MPTNPKQRLQGVVSNCASNDETIQPGFSGAPVWNRERSCVIGMVATAVVPEDEQRSKAYVIPTHKLQSVLKKVDALMVP